MERLEITFKVITPLFLSGANQAQAEFRPASLKGAMRYWYRALDPNYREREAEIFGGTGKGEGQSKFLLRYEPMQSEQRVWSKSNIQKFNVGSGKNTKNGLAYFSHSLARTRRAYLFPRAELKLQLLFRTSTTEEIRKAVLGSLWMLGHIGGLGSRSRRGFGTIALQSWGLPDSVPWPEINELPIAHTARTPQEWVDLCAIGLQVLRNWFGTQREVTHTVLDDNCRFLFLNEPYAAGKGHEAWAYALNRSGRLMQDFRLRRKPDYVEVPPHICAVDPTVASLNQKKVKPNTMDEGPQRAAFGLPLIFRYSWLQGCEGISFQGEISNRNGSPVWIRVIEIEGKCYPFFAFMSAPLLPSQERIIGRIIDIREKEPGPEGKKKRKNIRLHKPSQQILADFQQYLFDNANVLEVKWRWKK